MRILLVIVAATLAAGSAAALQDDQPGNGTQDPGQGANATQDGTNGTGDGGGTDLGSTTVRAGLGAVAVIVLVYFFVRSARR